jgi:membrane protein
LAAVPVLMVGLYFSWLILLFGAQVAHAYQNRMAYLEERQAASLNQRCREFIALRLMECLGRRFQLGEPPASASDLAKHLMVPGCLVEDIMEPLLDARLAVEVAGTDPTYAPARPLDAIDCHDILLALRAGQGQELPTRDDPARAEVFVEFERILEAEKKAASAVTVQAMVNRSEKRTALPEKTIRALMSGKSG